MGNENDLLSSARALNSRVKQKEQEQATAEREAQEAVQKRYLLLMSAMVRVRRALREMQALELGERFFFNIHFEEVEGWPQLALQLEDSETPDAEFPAVMVAASVKEDQGVVDIRGHNLTDVQQIDLRHELDVETVSKSLKDTVKTYLDFAGDVIEDVLSNGASPYTYGPKAKNASSQADGGDMLTEDLFVEDHNANVLETHSTIEDVEALPSFDK